MKKTPRPPRTHHYLPQFLLEYFEMSDSTIQQYDCKDDKYSRAIKENLAAVNNLYTWTEEDGEKNVLIENLFRDLEGQISKVIKKLNALNFLINNEERSLLSFFVAMQMYRTPQNRERTKLLVSKMTKQFMKAPAIDSKQFTEHLKEVAKKYPELNNMKKESIESIRNTFLNEDYDLKVPNEYFLKFMIEGLKEIAGHIHEVGWIFLVSTETSQFVTSDDPYVMHRKRNPGEPFWLGPGIKILGTEITLPLTPKICLLMSPSYRGTSNRIVNQKIVRQINLRTASHCRRFLFGGNEILLKSIVKHLSLDTRGVLEPKVMVEGF